MQTFFTSDTHFDDKYAIQYFNRPFKSMGEFTQWVSQLNGNIKILPGSHDHLWLKDFVASEKVQVIAPLVSVEFPEIMAGKHPQVVVMCHYSMQVWDRSNYGAWHLFGHSHGNLKGMGLSFDVGVDCTEFTPLPLEAVASKMAHLTKRAADGG